MELNNLRPSNGAIHKSKRVGRGQGSGYGGTSTRGHKGAKSRSGYSKKVGFEGGQMPLQRRVPKFGFKNVNRLDYKGINLDSIQELADSSKVKTITPELLISKGLASKNDRIKILGRGKLSASLEVNAHAFSAAAKDNIEDQGGKANII